MENKNCKTTFGESYDTDELMSQYYSSEGKYYSLFSTCAQRLTSKWSTSEIWGKNLELQPPVLEHLPPACTAAVSCTTVMWENFCAVLKHTSHFIVALYYLWNQVSEMMKR